jgi:hypothetical protein
MYVKFYLRQNQRAFYARLQRTEPARIPLPSEKLAQYKRMRVITQSLTEL